MILYINCCVREGSRTDRIARALLQSLGEDYLEFSTEKEALRPLDRETLEERTALIEAGDYSHPMFRYAKQFAEADQIVIAAPNWDMSFPASLKVYIENIYVTGLVSRYGSDGRPQGLCRASKLYYVTTSGGPFIPDFGYEYIRCLAEVCFGIEETAVIQAEMLDVDGVDPEAAVESVIGSLRRSRHGNETGSGEEIHS